MVQKLRADILATWRPITVGDAQPLVDGLVAHRRVRSKRYQDVERRRLASALHDGLQQHGIWRQCQRLHQCLGRGLRAAQGKMSLAESKQVIRAFRNRQTIARFGQQMRHGLAHVLPPPLDARELRPRLQSWQIGGQGHVRTAIARPRSLHVAQHLG